MEHQDRKRHAIFEMVVWRIPKSKTYPEGVKYRAWFSENGQTLFGFDNHQPKGPHLHIRNIEIGYLFRGFDELKNDIKAMIEKKGFIYEE